MSDEIARWIKDIRRETMELKPCWKCGKEAMTWSTDRWAPKGSVTCPDDDCMEDSEYYTVEEWQNHPRLGDAICKASMFATINIKGYEAIQDRISQAVREATKGATEEILGHMHNSPMWHANYHYVDYTKKPKRKSWIEKIRDYDYQKAMKDYFKESRDMWKDTAIARQARLENIGMRLKFSTHGLKFLIEIGNPFTLCTMHYHGWIQNFYSVAMKNPIDEMDWKKAAVQSVENLCREWVGDRDIQSSIFEALFSAHPELRTK
jgi:hypothetical protein